MKIFSYKGYEGTAEVDTEQEICRGKILFIDDVVTYKAVSVPALKAEFEAAVDDYLETCEALHKSPEKPCKGQFNVRISPDKHRAAILRAANDGMSLNEVTSRALDAYLCVSPEIRTHEVHHQVHILGNRGGDIEFTEVISGKSDPTFAWSAASAH